MFLFIFDDGSKKLYEYCAEDDLRAVDDGNLEIIDVSQGDNPREYFSGKWESIQPAK